jgi:RNA recognition motif-containing protein
MTKLYVGNLSFEVTDDSLQQLFTAKGYQVSSARVITDRESGRSRGFGFVELGSNDEAARAIGELNGLNVKGRALQVNEARPQEFRNGDRSGSGRPPGDERVAAVVADTRSTKTSARDSIIRPLPRSPQGSGVCFPS